MTESTAISGQSAILPVVGSTMKAQKIADNANRDPIMRDILRKKKIVEL